MTLSGLRKASVMSAEGLMRHEWVFDVLQDLLSYATLNGLPRLAERVGEAMEVAREEISAQRGSEESGGDPSGDPPQSPPSGGRQMH
jgi:hypothetical protein